jgi:hypothetical protein
MFRKISGKPIEHYVVSRLWHGIDDLDVEMVLQQYVRRQEERYALVDIAFPQIGLFIEINEPQHYNSQETIASDKQRIEEIKQKTGKNLYVFDCRKTLAEINSEIEKIAAYIRSEVARKMLAGEFESWDPDLRRNADYWKSVGSLSTMDNVVLSTIEEICVLFGADFSKIKRGFLRVGGIKHPEDRGLFLWWPSLKKRAKWINEISDNGKTITERYDSIEKTNSSYKPPDNPEKDRVVFVHRKDVFGIMGYWFAGVYRYNQPISLEQNASVWSRVRDNIKLMK